MKLKVLALLAAVLVMVGLVAVPSVSALDEVWIGEFQNCQLIAVCRDNVPPARLNIDMYDGNLNGVDPVTRCNNMGGTPHWHYSWHYTCLDVDT